MLQTTINHMILYYFVAVIAICNAFDQLNRVSPRDYNNAHNSLNTGIDPDTGLQVEFSEDVEVNIAFLQNMIESTKKFQISMKLMYDLFMDHKIEEYMNDIQNIIESTLDNTYNVLYDEFSPQILNNTEFALSRLNKIQPNFSKNNQLSVDEMKEIMSNYHSSKKKIFQSSEFETHQYIANNVEIASIIQKLFVNLFDFSSLLNVIVSDIIPIFYKDAKKQITLFLLPHSFPYLDQIKNSMLIYNLSLNDTKLINKTTFIDYYNYPRVRDEDPLIILFPDYSVQINKFFDEIKRVQKGKNISLNDSVLVWKLNINNLGDIYDWDTFRKDIIGEYFEGKFITRSFPDSINGKCMKWCQNDIDKINSVTFGCVVAINAIPFF